MTPDKSPVQERVAMMRPVQPGNDRERPCPRCGVPMDAWDWCSRCARRRLLFWAILCGAALPGFGFWACSTTDASFGPEMRPYLTGFGAYAIVLSGPIMIWVNGGYLKKIERAERLRREN